MKQKKQVAALAVLLVILGLVWFFYFQQPDPSDSTDVASAAQNHQLLSVDNPQLHNDGVERARRTEYKSGGRNIFSRELPPPPPPKNPKPVDPIPIPKPQPVVPTVSPLPVKFYGYGIVPNGTIREAFFTDGEDIYVVPEGQVLLNRFRILKIGNVNLEYEEISSGLRGTAPLEEQGAPPSAQ